MPVDRNFTYSAVGFGTQQMGNTLKMATHDYVIANQNGAAVRADLNGALEAIVSNNSSATEPATTYAYQWWADTTATSLKLRNSDNDGWVIMQELDGTMLMEDGKPETMSTEFRV